MGGAGLPITLTFAHCPWPVWRVDDFTPCFRDDFLGVLFPGFVICISILLLVLQLVQQGIMSTQKNASQSTGPNGNHDGISSRAEEEVFAIGFNRLASVTTAANDSLTELHRSRPQCIVIIEELAIFGFVTMKVVAFILETYGSRRNLAPLTGLVFWLYVLTLATAQLVLKRCHREIPQAWNHLAAIYAFQWLFTIVLFWSAIAHPRSRLSQTLTIFEFALSSLLFFIVITTQKSNEAVPLEREGDLKPSKEPLASVFSELTLSWADSIVWEGFRKPFELPDVWNLVPKDKAFAVLTEYRQLKRTTKLAWRLLYHFRFNLLKQWTYSFVSVWLTFASILILKAILEYIEKPDGTPLNVLWLYVILLSATDIIRSLLNHQVLWTGSKAGIRIRAIMIGEIYAKALRRKALTSNDTELGSQKSIEDPLLDSAPEAASTQVNVGTIINLMSSDSFSIAGISDCLYELISDAPAQLIGCVFLLWRILGPSSIPGLLIMFSFAPVSYAFSTSYGKAYRKVMVATDERIHTINENLQSIRILKYFAWQKRFSRIVDEKRSTELKARFHTYLIWAGVLAVRSMIPLMITCCSFLVYTLVEKKPLYPSVAFPALSLFSILQGPLDQLVTTTFYVRQAMVSVNRVEEFLSEAETEKYKQLCHNNVDEDGVKMVGFTDGSFSWVEKSAITENSISAFCLMNLNIRFAIGKLNIIAGPTGSGKTSLLMALLGEMTMIKGKVFLPGGNNRDNIQRNSETGLTESVAYCAQQPWLVNANIKDNVLFGEPLDEQRYKDVLRACALERDLEIFEFGDQTLVGEKGISLSGGQKQRISLARALYSDSECVLLDDCLSSVDSHTAKSIFHDCIKGPLMRNRTCILVTNNVRLCVPFSDYVVVLENGRVAAQGTPEVVDASGKLSTDIYKIGKGSEALGILSTDISEQDMRENTQSDLPNGRTKGHLNSSKNAMDESKAVGSVKLNVLVLYLGSMGSWRFWLLGILVFTGKLLLGVAPNLWIRQWVNLYDTFNVSSTPSHYIFTNCPTADSLLPWSALYSVHNKPSIPAIHAQEVDALYNLLIYALIGLSGVVMILFHFLWYIYGSFTAASYIHQQLVESVYHSKFNFFDVTPLGQLMNRFSGDVKCVDQEVVFTAVSVKDQIVAIVVSVIMIIAIAPGFLLAAVFISLMYVVVGVFYIRSSRDLNRLESIQRSPLFQHFGETLTGITTIRAYGHEKRFIEDNLQRTDTHTRPDIYLEATNIWLSLRLDLVGAFVIFFAGLFIIFGIETIDAGSAGLMLSYAIRFTGNLLQLVQKYATLERNMNSMERIKEYLDVEREQDSIGGTIKPPANWPSQGSIEFVNYTTRYRPDLNPVLRCISFKIAPGERVGVVGRTGAGKSSLALALFRGLEAEEGKILIDKYDISHVPLDDLRASITIVPQDPTLLSGTIRTNLDLFNHHTDAEIFAVLRRVQLIGAGKPSTEPLPIHSSGPAISNPGSGSLIDISAQPPNRNVFLNLSTPVAESGNNFSQGERQQLCLARALLKDAQVLVMDEATASIDYNKDARIQETVRKLKCTIITIAHRLQTIIDYDKVVVLDKGEVVEFGHPHDLLKKDGEDAVFKNMCSKSGDIESLQGAAKRAYDESQLVDVE